MFDFGVIHLIEGNNIDRPGNAITLTSALHAFFGNFKVVFEPTEEKHKYIIRSLLHPSILPDFPVTCTLNLTENRTIEPPSPRLLALHRAIANIMHLSGAAGYVDEILRDMEFKDTRADGSTELGYLVFLRMSGWLSEIQT